MKLLSGFTLIELLIAISVLTITLIVAIPSCYDLIARNRAQIVVNQLISTLNYARYQAMLFGKKIIWCGSQDKKHCTADWSKGQIIFVDVDGTHQVTNKNKLLRDIESIPGKGKLRWHGFDGTDYLQLSPYSLSVTMDGRFSYFAADGNPKYAREVIVNRMGRGRISVSRAAPE